MGNTELSPRAARTRAALISAGFDLLANKPIDAIPIDELVATAGVAKGSFFNHFADKKDFALTIATELRLELEGRVARANAGVSDPIARIAGGMRVSATFAIQNPKWTVVLLRGSGGTTIPDHPLNKGLVDDIAAACAQGLLRPEARESGVIFWLGLCHILATNLVEGQLDQRAADRRLADMIILGLTGLGVSEDSARQLAKAP